MHNPKPIPGRRSYRIPGYDYRSPGFYYITVCTYGRKCLFGEILENRMVANVNGDIVGEEWFKTAAIRPEIELDAFVVRPNHIHAIMRIIDDPHAGGTTRRVAHTAENGPPSGSIGAVIGQIKSITTKRINAVRGAPGDKVWQRNYFERIVRDEKSLKVIREYIRNNPANWDRDRFKIKRF